MKIGVGDPVEVKFAAYDPKRGRNAVEKWVPATVAFVDDIKIVVVFADHTRMSVERGRHQFRRMKDGECNLG